MKTEAATALSDRILSDAKSLEETAKRYAVNYAESDDPADKAAYKRYAFAAQEIRKLHAPACQVLHVLESLIPVPAQEQQP